MFYIFSFSVSCLLLEELSQPNKFCAKTNSFGYTSSWVSIYTISLISQCEYWETAIPLVVLLHIIKAKIKSNRICLGVLILWAIIEYLVVPQYGQIPLFNSPFISIWYTIFASLSCVALSKYNGDKGKKILPRYFFYLFYPGHLFILGIIREVFIMI